LTSRSLPATETSRLEKSGAAHAEDNLDGEFIYNSLVPIFRVAKEHRQIIALLGMGTNLTAKTTRSVDDPETSELLPISPWDQPFFGTFTALFVLFVVVWIYAIPGYVAHRDGVLTPSGVAKHIKGEAATQWANYLHRRNEYQARINSVDAQLATGAKSSQDSAALVALRERYVSEMNARPPLVLVGMVGNWLNEIWAISYLTLGCLIAVWGYPRIRLSLLHILGWTLALYVLSFMQLWTRNHLLTSPELGRTTFYWVNWDVSKTSYVLQDIRQCVMFVFICTFWELGAQRLRILRQALANKIRWPEDPISRVTSALSVFRRALALWQVSTVLMLVLFVPWSFFYWNQIVVNRDMRYLPAVLFIDILWMLTWFVSSRPFLLAMRWWNEEKVSAIAAWTGDATQLNALLAEGENSSELQVIVASLTAVGSMLLPLIKLLLSK
jgi:hypothetical protein